MQKKTYTFGPCFRLSERFFDHSSQYFDQEPLYFEKICTKQETFYSSLALMSTVNALTENVLFLFDISLEKSSDKRGRNWSDESDKEISNVLACLVELIVVEVIDNRLSIVDDSLVVLDGVSKHGLDKLNWMTENGGPLLNSGNIVLDIFTVLKSLREFLNDSANSLSSLNNVRDIALREVRDGLFNISLKLAAVLDAVRNLGEVVLSNQTLNKSSNDLSNLLRGHLERLLLFLHKSVADLSHVFSWRDLGAVVGEKSSVIVRDIVEHIIEIAEVGSIVSSNGFVSNSGHHVDGAAVSWMLMVQELEGNVPNVGSVSEGLVS